MTDPVASVAYAMKLARLFAAVHCALSAPERARLIKAGVPATTSLDLDDVVRAAYALDRARAKRAVALIRAHLAQVVLPEDCTFLHGDLHSHNVVVDDEGRITGLFDFDESCVGDRHHEFRFMPTFGRMFFERVLQVYGELTGVTVDVRRVLRIYALALLAQLGWGLRDPADHVQRSGRTVDETCAWAERAVDDASRGPGQ